MTPGVLFWIRTAFRFIRRSGRSTAALSVMVVTAVAALIFLASLAVGVNDAMVRNSIGLYTGHISGRGLPASVAPAGLMIEGVAHVLKRVEGIGALSHGDRVRPVSLVGVDPAGERRATALPEKRVEGRYLRQGSADLFLSRSLAAELGIKTGDTVRFIPLPEGAPLPLTVRGIYETGIDALDRGIAFASLTAVPEKRGTWQAAVFLDPGVDPDRVIAAYRRGLPEGVQFRSWRDIMPDLVQLIDLNYVSMGIVVVLVFGVVSLGIACAMVIFIFKNLREYGILKAMGVRSGEMGLLIGAEVMWMNLIGCGAGLLLGAGLVGLVGVVGVDLTAWTSHNRYFAVSGLIYPRLTPFSTLMPPALSILFGLAAAVWPAVLVNRKKAADILRIV